MPPPHTTVAYGWVLTAGQLGVALGAATAGQLDDRAGTAVAFLVVPAALLMALALAAGRRHTIALTGRPAGPDGRA